MPRTDSRSDSATTEKLLTPDAVRPECLHHCAEIFDGGLRALGVGPQQCPQLYLMQSVVINGYRRPKSTSEIRIGQEIVSRGRVRAMAF
jgi:hypothetical protein